MNDNEKLKYIKELNEKYRANNYNGISSSNINFKIIHGRLPILLSAPHAVRQSRNEKTKGADTLTGPIVEFLCERTNANGIIRTFNLDDDPNSENVGYSLAYKNAILKIINEKNIGCIIDIHGCNDNHTFDIDIGTNNGKNINKENNLLSIIYENLAILGNVVIDKEFKASQETTICNYINKKTNTSCFQIELSTSLRKNPDKLLKLLNSFEKIIEELSKQFTLEKSDIELEI